MNTKFRVLIVSREGKEIETGWELGNLVILFSELNNECFLYYFSILCIFDVLLYLFLICYIRKEILSACFLGVRILFCRMMFLNDHFIVECQRRSRFCLG